MYITLEDTFTTHELHDFKLRTPYIDTLNDIYITGRRIKRIDPTKDSPDNYYSIIINNNAIFYIGTENKCQEMFKYIEDTIKANPTANYITIKQHTTTSTHFTSEV